MENVASFYFITKKAMTLSHYLFTKYPFVNSNCQTRIYYLKYNILFILKQLTMVNSNDIISYRLKGGEKVKNIQLSNVKEVVETLYLILTGVVLIYTTFKSRKDKSEKQANINITITNNYNYNYNYTKPKKKKRGS